VHVGHTYRDTGAVAPYVVVTWAGTFTVDGGSPWAVDRYGADDRAAHCVAGPAGPHRAGQPLRVAVHPI
jgi:hypothetical protein